MRSRQLARRLVMAAALVGFAAPRSVQADTSPVSTLKAAFLYNFAKFTEWPVDALAPGQRLSLCVVGDTDVADALEQTIKGRAAEGHELTVEVLEPNGALRSCHLLYVGGSDQKRSLEVLAAVKGAPVFTVSDGDRFAQMGGVAQLVVEGGRMRFAVNLTAARRARLQLSSKLLSLAQLVKDQQ